MTKTMKASAKLISGAFTLCAFTACGGQPKPADSPGVCPDGTALHGTDCVAEGNSAGASAAGEPTSSTKSAADEPPASAPGTPNTGDSVGHSALQGDAAGPSALADTPYDRDSVEVELKRGARQVKANCGAATDEDGKASGPWGKTKAGIVLGRNGHIRHVSVPPPYDGKPVGLCIVHSFEKIQFPPYSASGDVTVDWDVDLVEPKH